MMWGCVIVVPAVVADAFVLIPHPFKLYFQSCSSFSGRYMLQRCQPRAIEQGAILPETSVARLGPYLLGMSALWHDGGNYELDLPSAEVVPMVAMVREPFRPNSCWCIAATSLAQCECGCKCQHPEIQDALV